MEVQREIIEDADQARLQGSRRQPERAEEHAAILQEHVNPKMALVMTDNDLPDPAARQAATSARTTIAPGAARANSSRRRFPRGARSRSSSAASTRPTPSNAGRECSMCWPARTSRKWAKSRRRRRQDLDLGNGYTLLATQVDLTATSNQVPGPGGGLAEQASDVDCLVGLWEYNPPALLRAVRAPANDKKPLIVAFDENHRDARRHQDGRRRRHHRAESVRVRLSIDQGPRQPRPRQRRRARDLAGIEKRQLDLRRPSRDHRQGQRRRVRGGREEDSGS